MSRIILFSAILAFEVGNPLSLTAQDFLVFKVMPHFNMGGVTEASRGASGYYVNIGSEGGVQPGTILSVYRNKEIESEAGNFKITSRLFIGRMKAIEVHPSYCVARLVEQASYSDSHRDYDAVMAGDYVLPAISTAAIRQTALARRVTVITFLQLGIPYSLKEQVRDIIGLVGQANDPARFADRMKLL